MVEGFAYNCATHERGISDFLYSVNGETYIETVYAGSMHIGDRVRERMRAVGISTATELLRRIVSAGGKISQPQISALLKGEVESPTYMVELAEVLKTTPGHLKRGDEHQSISATVPTAETAADSFPLAAPVPSLNAQPLVILRATAWPGRHGGFVVLKEKVGEAARPAQLAYSPNAFLFEVKDDSLEPRYRRREHLTIDPDDDTPAPDHDYFFVHDPKAWPLEGVVLRLVKITATHWVVKGFTLQARERKLDRAEWRGALRIVGHWMF